MSEVTIGTPQGNSEADDILIRAREALRLISMPAIIEKPAAAAPAAKHAWHADASPAPSKTASLSQSAHLPRIHLLLCSLLIVSGLALVFMGNKAFGPEMYAEDGLRPAVEAFGRDENYAVFDLNLNIRRLRELHLSQMTSTPDVVVLGASQWQEANHTLVGGMKYYNAHVHRDYWQDMLGVSELLVRNNRLPKRMIISLRDNLFTPIASRKDFLWEPGIVYYRAMADRLGVEKESYWTSLPYQRIKQLFSIFMLFDNVTRWYNADQKPQATTEHRLEALDTLLPDGSIVWSQKHMDIFTQERSKRESLAFAEKRLNDPPQIEEHGIEAIDTLLGFLKSKGVTVYIAQTPFNPIFYDRVQGSAYAAGLAKVDARIHGLAAKHGMKMIGGYNPHKVGCKASMYIDAEHANASCLKNIFDQFRALDALQAAS